MRPPYCGGPTSASSLSPPEGCVDPALVTLAHALASMATAASSSHHRRAGRTKERGTRFPLLRCPASRRPDAPARPTGRYPRRDSCHPPEKLTGTVEASLDTCQRGWGPPTERGRSVLNGVRFAAGPGVVRSALPGDREAVEGGQHR